MRQLVRAWVHLAVLWSFAVAQPLFDVLGDAPEFFVARDNTRSDILVFAFTLTLLPPTALTLLELALLRWSGARQALHVAFVGLLAAAVALQILDDLLPLGGSPLVAIALAAGVASAFHYARREEMRSLLSVLAPAPAVFLALFLLASPVSKLVLPQDTVSAAPGTVGADAPVVMVVFDEFAAQSLLDRRLGIDSKRYRGFADLAEHATWYRNATTVDSATQRAVPAILTSTTHPDKLPIASDHPDSLFTMLGGRYSMHVGEHATALCPESVCGHATRPSAASRLGSLLDDLSVVSLHLLLPQNLEDALPSIDATFQGFGDQARDVPVSVVGERGIPAALLSDRKAQFEQFLRDIDGDSMRPTLDFLHVALPHTPWEYFPSGRPYLVETTGVPGLTGETWDEDSAAATHGYQRYLLQVGYVDRLISRLLARLRREGLFDRALLVVMADHGVSFRAGLPRRDARAETFADIGGIPLFVKAPGQPSGRTSDSPVRSIDVLPTIAKTLRVEPDWQLEGRPLEAEPRPPGPLTVANPDGSVTVSFTRFERLRTREVARKVRLFGTGTHSKGLVAFGSHADLIGRRARALSSGRSSSVRTDLRNPERLASVDLGAPVPAILEGSFEGPIGDREPLAVALNGTVRTVVSSYRYGQVAGFAALLPAEGFRPGTNRVQVYAIGAGRLPLTLLPQAGGM